MQLAASADCCLGLGNSMFPYADIHLRAGGQRLNELISFLDVRWKWTLT